MSFHAPVTTLEELDALDEAELMAGYMSAERGDPEPGANHTKAYHHGWRMRMMDLHEMPIPAEHRQLVHEHVARSRARRQKAERTRSDREDDPRSVDYD